MFSPLLNYWYRMALPTLAVAAVLLSTRTSLGQVDLAAQARDAANYVNQIRANPAAFAGKSASLADPDVQAQPPLVWNVALQQAAERKARFMADHNQASHFLTINGQQVGMNQWMREAGYPLVSWLRNDDTNFECIHWEFGQDLNTIGRRVIDSYLAEGKDGGHVRPILGRTNFYKNCKDIGVGIATDANGKAFVSLLVGVFDPQNPNVQPPAQPAALNPSPALITPPVPAALPALPQLQLQFQKGADVGGGAFTSSLASNGTTQWTETSKDPNSRISFTQKKRDNNWIYIFDASRNMTVILPIAGGMSHFSTDGEQTWTPLSNLSVSQAANPAQSPAPPPVLGQPPAPAQFPVQSPAPAQFPSVQPIAPAQAAPLVPLTGTWTNRDGGTANIVVNAAGVVQMSWIDRQNQLHSTGLGFIQDGHLLAAWAPADNTSYGINLYKIGLDGTLKARWTSTESGGRSVSTVESAGGTPGVLEGTYRFSAGSMLVAKSGATYSVVWTNRGQQFGGIGLRQGDWLVVSWSQSNSARLGVVDYTIQGNTLQGTWAKVGQNQVGSEILDRATN